MNVLRRLLVQYLELVLTALGLGICLVLIAGLPPGADKWYVIAIAAMVIGVIHGIIFFAVRARQRALRLQAIREVACMLQERVTSYVNIVTCLSESDNSGHQQMARRAASDMADFISGLSEDSLVNWREGHDAWQFPPQP